MKTIKFCLPCVTFEKILSWFFDQIRKKLPLACQRLRDSEFIPRRQRSASLSPDLFKLGLKNNSLDVKKAKAEILGSTVSSLVLQSEKCLFLNLNFYLLPPEL